MRLRRTIVPVPDRRNLLGLYPLARIADGEAGRPVALPFEFHAHQLVFARIIDRIADQII
ncbi:MAG: hypothetical protein BHW45_02135 [Roseburia sp. CAG:197_41_10]|nr:MAG: hypothetical protein BHW45_02135 [Roseburia sp. CAG:197_41_10]